MTMDFEIQTKKINSAWFKNNIQYILILAKRPRININGVRKNAIQQSYSMFTNKSNPAFAIN